jgi:hypothetical protein
LGIFGWDEHWRKKKRKEGRGLKEEWLGWVR